MNPAPNAPGTGLTFKAFLDGIFVNPWPWWVSGIGIGLTLIAFAWYAGRKLGVSTGYADACKRIDPQTAAKYPKIKSERLWLLLGIPLGALLANAGWWNWSWTLGRLDMVSSGNFLVKALLLLFGGACLGFGARWAGGCVTGHSLAGVPLGHRMSIAMTVVFLASGILLAFILFKVL